MSISEDWRSLIRHFLPFDCDLVTLESLDDFRYDMLHSIATDEAGYGPNLGPLAIGATRWMFPDAETDPQRILEGLVFDQKSHLNRFESESGTPGLMIADSKAVYSTGKIELLERGVLGCLYAIHQTVPTNVAELLRLLQIDRTQIQSSDYFQCNGIGLPLKSDLNVIKSVGDRLRKKLADASCSLEGLAVTLVFPKQFNRGIEEHGNKASCLTAESLQLIAGQMNRAQAKPKDRFDIRCDKHGGRSRYAPAIQEHFGNSWVTIEEEGRPRSAYRFDDGRVVISFTAKGESWLPIALASMCAKYSREIFMLRWNRFWKTHLPHLKPTKGYPVDAKRFKKDIAKVQKKIGIPDEDIWRCR